MDRVSLRPVMRRLEPVVVLLVGFVAVEVRAADARAVRLEYAAGADCPDRATFVEQVLRRSPGVRLAVEGEQAPEFGVAVVQEGSGSRARLTVLDGEAPPQVRELAASDCAELVASMAVVISLAIDSRFARREPAATSSAESTSASNDRAPDASRSAAEQPRATASEASADLPSTTTSPERDTAPDQPGARLPIRGHAWVLGGAAAVVSDIAPEWSPGAVVFSDLGFAGDLRARLSLAYATSGDLTLNGASTRFSLLTGRAELCPVAFQAATQLAIRPCAGVEFGTHHAEGKASARIEEPKSSSALWLAGMLALRAELDVTSWLSLALEAQARVPFLHRSYVLERPDDVAYETPSLGAGVQLGVGFPVLK